MPTFYTIAMFFTLGWSLIKSRSIICANFIITTIEIVLVISYKSWTNRRLVSLLSILSLVFFLGKIWNNPFSCISKYSVRILIHMIWYIILHLLKLIIIGILICMGVSKIYHLKYTQSYQYPFFEKHWCALNTPPSLTIYTTMYNQIWWYFSTDIW